MNSPIPDSIQVVPFSNRQIVREADKLTRKYAAEVKGLLPLGISFDSVYERVIYPDYQIDLKEGCDLGTDANGDKILGKFDPISNTVYIDEELHAENRDPRRAFTLWHEVGGHAVLQGDWLRKEFARVNRSWPLVTTAPMIELRTEIGLERQANLYASHAAAPSWLLNRVIRLRFGMTRPFRFIGPGSYTLIVLSSTMNHDVDDLYDFCRRIAYQVRHFFGGLSIEALSYRIADSGWVDDVSHNPFELHRVERRRVVARA